MKVLTRNTIKQVLKVGIITSLLGCLMLMGVDLFSNLDTYTNHKLPGKDILILTFLYFPEAFLLAMGPSFLFSVSYYLSMLHANNEIMCILNSGINFKKLIRPIIVLSFAVAVFYFVFNESVAINSSNQKTAKMKIITDSSENELDNSDVALSDMQHGYMVYASKYSDSTKMLHNVSFVIKNDINITRIDALNASYNEISKKWTFKDCYVYDSDGSEVKCRYNSEMEVPEMTLEPELFRNLSTQVSKMDLPMAKNYVRRMKNLNPEQYAPLATEYYERIYSFITPLVMMIIACSMNYRFKKNVLFFSIVCSICVAVVYYVVQMMTLMLANQGIIEPYLGMILPFVVIILFTSLMSALIKS